MLNILLVFTGGTIGSVSSNNTINTNRHQQYHLLELFNNKHSDHHQINFKTIQPVEILSENLLPSVWQNIIRAIEAEDIEKYDGIIITHGTDTLAFTAAALGLYFNTLKIPLLLVSSNYPLQHSQANGLTNFICAIEFIKQRQEVGVFIPYQNQNADMLVHLGTRLASCLQLSGDFVSVQFKAYLSFKQNQFIQHHSLSPAECRPTRLAPLFSSRVLLIKPYPGLNYSSFNLEQNDAVIHDLYHSGTACSTQDWGDKYCLQKFIKKCQANNIDFYMAPAVKTKHLYQSTQSLLDQGAIMIWDMSLESAYTKLLLAYGNFSEDYSKSQFLEKNIAFEFI